MRMRMTWGMLELRTVSSVFGSGPVVCMLEDPPHTPKMISKTKLARGLDRRAQTAPQGAEFITQLCMKTLKYASRKYQGSASLVNICSTHFAHRVGAECIYQGSVSLLSFCSTHFAHRAHVSRQ